MTSRLMTLAAASLIAAAAVLSAAALSAPANAAPASEAVNTSTAAPGAADADRYGTLEWPDGTRYVGEVQDGKRWGKGVLYWKDGTTFSGTFVDDKRHGIGTMTLPDGTSYVAVYDNDRITVLSRDGTLPDGSAPEPAPPMENAPAPEMRAEVLASLDRWAKSWSDQNVDGYLASYHQSFTPPDQLSRAAWEAQRRDRLRRPNSIKVEVDGLELKRLEDGSVEVRFTQRYRSDTYRDVVTKVLVFSPGKNGWQIVAERSV